SCSGWEARVIRLDAEGEEAGCSTAATVKPPAMSTAAGNTRTDSRLLSVLGVRLGMNQIKGLSQEVAKRIESARAQQPFSSLADLVQRAGPGRRDVEVLAAADALRSLAGDRRQAAWVAATTGVREGLLQHADVVEYAPRLAQPSEA